MSDRDLVLVEIPEVSVKSWSPGKEGEGVPCTQVHLVIEVPAVSALFITRFKGRQAVQSLIDALVEHRDFVWPQAKGDRR